MARLFSNVLLKDIANLRTARSSRVLFCNYGMMYSTTVPNDLDSHEDCQPKDNDESSVESRKYDVDKAVKENQIMIFMYGTPYRPQGRWGYRARSVLEKYKWGVEVALGYRDMEENPEVKEAVKEYSGYLTFPQIFIKGEFIGGGVDKLEEMHKSGELKQKIQDLLEESDLEESD